MIFSTRRLLAAALTAGSALGQGVNTTTPPLNYGILLFQAYEPLDVWGPWEVLHTVARSHQLNLYFISESLDPVTTAPKMAAMNPHNSSSFYGIQPTHTLSSPPEDLDVLIVPGGIGTINPNMTHYTDYLSAAYPSLRYLMTVCTGTQLLARSGVLDGRTATTNKSAWKRVTAEGPRTNWIAKARWVVDGNIWTSAGVSAGIDSTLAFVEHIYGKAFAEKVAIDMEYDWHQDADWDPFSALYNLTSTTPSVR